MKHIITTVVILTVLFGAVSCGLRASPLPYGALEDMKEADVVDRNYVLCGDNLPVPAFALHPEGKGWWMLWITSSTWIFSYFGDADTEPAPRTRPTLIYYGRWEVEGPAETGTRHLFTIDHVTPDPGPEKSSELFCPWLVPNPA